MIRAPLLTHDQMEALRVLLKVDYLRNARGLLHWVKDSDGTVEEAVANLMELTNAYTDRDTPLTVAIAVSEMHSESATKLLLSDSRFRYLSTLTSLELEPGDFPGATPDALADILPPLRDMQKTIGLAFRDAGFIHHAVKKEVLN